MSGVARIMLRPRHPGHRQRRQGRPRRCGRCATSGAAVHVGHDAAHVADADTLVVSTAVRDDNPELRRRAATRGLRVLPALGRRWPPLMAGPRRVAVAGTHGKTTTTSMLTVALQALRRRPVVRHRRRARRAPAATPTTAPATCSSPRPTRATASFLVYRPDVGDRHQRRRRPPRLLGHVRGGRRPPSTRFVGTIRPGGLLVTCADDAGVARAWPTWPAAAGIARRSPTASRPTPTCAWREATAAPA